MPVILVAMMLLLLCCCTGSVQGEEYCLLHGKNKLSVVDKNGIISVTNKSKKIKKLISITSHEMLKGKMFGLGGKKLFEVDCFTGKTKKILTMKGKQMDDIAVNSKGEIYGVSFGYYGNYELNYLKKKKWKPIGNGNLLYDGDEDLEMVRIEFNRNDELYATSMISEENGGWGDDDMYEEYFSHKWDSSKEKFKKSTRFETESWSGLFDDTWDRTSYSGMSFREGKIKQFLMAGTYETIDDYPQSYYTIRATVGKKGSETYFRFTSSLGDAVHDMALIV